MRRHAARQRYETVYEHADGVATVLERPVAQLLARAVDHHHAMRHRAPIDPYEDHESRTLSGTYWIAEGPGMVRAEQDNGTNQTTYELTSWSHP